VQDRIGVERWINEGGHIATDAVIQREMAAGNDAPEAAGQHGQTARGAEASSATTPVAVPVARSPEDPARSRVLIAGGGVAGLETLLALRALAPGRLDITILAPELKFINLSIASSSRSSPSESEASGCRKTGLRARRSLAPGGGGPRRARAQPRGHQRRRRGSVRHARGPPEREWHSEEVLTYHGGRDGPNYLLLLHPLFAGPVSKLASSSPPGRPRRCRCTT